MTELVQVETPVATEATVDTTDRRRPGRLRDVSPALIPILRTGEAEAAITFEDADQTAAVRGIAFGVLLSAPIWAAIAYLGTWFLS